MVQKLIWKVTVTGKKNSGKSSIVSNAVYNTATQINSRGFIRKRDIMLEALDDEMTDATWSRPDGGMFLWVKLSKNMDALKMLKRAINNKVAYVTGSAFYHNNPEMNTMRLNFTYSSDDDLKEGVRRLAKTVKDEKESL